MTRTPILAHVGLILQLVGLITLWSADLLASPVLIVDEEGAAQLHITHVAVVHTEGAARVIVQSDYMGPKKKAALLMAVPSGTLRNSVVAFAPEVMDQLISVSAPRFAEFWEQKLCDKNTDERDTEAVAVPNRKAVPSQETKAEQLDVHAAPQQHTRALGEVEYGHVMIGTRRELFDWLQRQGLHASRDVERISREYEEDGYLFLALSIDMNQVTFFDDVSAMLTPISFKVSGEFSRIPARFGLASLADAHDLYIYTIDVERRATSNYPTRVNATNFAVNRLVRTHMGKFVNSVLDEFQHRHPSTFLQEYAWPALECAAPCPSSPLNQSALNELAGVTSLDGHDYVLSRLHYRYEGKDLPLDPVLARARPVVGGVAPPKGSDGRTDSTVRHGDENAFVTRYVHAHQLRREVSCNPSTSRWGAAPIAEPGSPEVFAARHMSRERRDAFDLSATTDAEKLTFVALDPPTVQPQAVSRLGSCACSTTGHSRGDLSAPFLTFLLGASLGLRLRLRTRKSLESIRRDPRKSRARSEPTMTPCYARPHGATRVWKTIDDFGSRFPGLRCRR